MGRKSSTKKSGRLPQRKQTSVPRSVPTVNKQPQGQSIGSTIGQGVALGTGVALGSTIANGALDMIKNSDNQVVSSNNNCQYIFESFQKCMYSTNDIELCRPQLDLFNLCNK